ncbi:MAG: A/G-specific adenine glycosylase, partial [Candidatus Margulisiibacteriota bacterium]
PLSLLDWYARNKRSLPWRDDPAPYRVWLSEVMLQQTQVNTVLPYFERFISRFPDVFSLAMADQQDVLKVWEGLGYYSRARHLHRAAQEIVQGSSGQLPTTAKEWERVNGIGPYASAAIASIAFGEAIPVVDGNVIRVFARFLGIRTDTRDPKVRGQIFLYLKEIIVCHPPSDFNQAIMELGAIVCKPKKPLCEQCPLVEECFAKKNKVTEQLPFRSKATKIPHYEVGAALIWDKGAVLITQRPEDKMLGGLWEFPGGKQEKDETIEETVHREIKEETGLKIHLIGKLGQYKHAYTHFSICLHAYHSELVSGSDILIPELNYRWCRVEELTAYPFPEVDRKIIRDLLLSVEV